MTMQIKIQALATTFVEGVLQAVRAASIEDVLATSGRAAPAKAARLASPPKGKRVRRSAEDIAPIVERIVTTLKAHKGGLRSEQIQKVLKLSKKEIVRPIAEALATKNLTKTGEKRATKYFAGRS